MCIPHYDEISSQSVSNASQAHALSPIVTSHIGYRCDLYHLLVWYVVESKKRAMKCNHARYDRPATTD